MSTDKSLAVSVLRNSLPDNSYIRNDFDFVIAAITDYNSTTLDLTYVKGRRIRFLPEKLHALMPNLKVLKIAKQNIETLPVDLEGLEEIDWRNNELFRIPSCLLNFKNLRRLNLDGNQIAHIQKGVMSNLTRLEKLSLIGHGICWENPNNRCARNEMENLPLAVIRVKHVTERHVLIFGQGTKLTKASISGQAVLGAGRVQPLRC